MLTKLKIFVLVLVMIAVPVATTFAGKAPAIDKKEAKELDKAGKNIKKIADDVGPAEADFQKAAEALEAAIKKAGKDKKYSKKEIANIKKLASAVHKEAKDLNAVCKKVTTRADKLAKAVDAAAD